MAKIKSIPMIIAAFIMLILGIIIIIYGIFHTMPSPYSSEGAVAIWVMVLVIGLILTFGSLWAIRYSEE